jgi:hypothetical protein
MVLKRSGIKWKCLINNETLSRFVFFRYPRFSQIYHKKISIDIYH